jgi:hypothetical protein
METYAVCVSINTAILLADISKFCANDVPN